MTTIETLETKTSTENYERVIAHAFKPVAAELRLVDLSALARHVLGNEYGNLRDLVESSAELYFQDDAFKYVGEAEIELSWGGEPKVTLPMKFSYNGITVIFDLSLMTLMSAIEVKALLIDPSLEISADSEAFLEEALKDAKVTKV